MQRILVGLSVIAVLYFVEGCGDDRAAPTDAAIGSPDARGDAPGDAPPDGPAPTSSRLLVNDGAGTITQWIAPNTFAGGSTLERFFIVNSGATTTSALSAAITGVDASSFALVVAGTTCGAPLVAGDMCELQISYAPTATGSQTATLDITTGDEHMMLPLSGVAPPMPGDALVASVPTLDFGSITKDESPTADIILTNTSASTITLGARTAATPFSVTDNCPATLTSGGSCTATILYHNAPLGSTTGTLHVASSANAVDVPLEGITLRELTVTLTGFGQGQASSVPTGISCATGTCSAGFPLGVDVTLTASNDASNMFVTWGGLCSGTGSCVVASPGDGTVTLEFVPTSAKKITITAAGTSASFSFVLNSSTNAILGRCTGSCLVYIPVNTQTMLYGYSPSTFASWMGDCSATTSGCNLGTVTSDRAVTITSNADAHEVATLLPSSSITGLAVAPTGDILFATEAGVTKTTLAGTVLWTTALASGATSLATDAAGNVYGVSGPGVFALTSTGTVAWTRTFAGVDVGGQSLDSAIATSPDGTVVAVLTADGVHVVDGGGVDRFIVTALSPGPQTVAVAPDGTVALVQYDAPLTTDQTQALRYTSTGTPLTALAPIPGNELASIAFDSTNSVCAVSTGFGEVITSRTTSALANVFTSPVEHDGFAGGTPAGVLVTSTDKVVAIRQLDEDPLSGMKLQEYSTTGTVLLTQTKTPTSGLLPPAFDDGVTPAFIAAGGTNRIAVAGTYSNSLPWIQVYDLP